MKFSKMMRKVVVSIPFLLLGTSLFAAAAKPSIGGRADVAEENEFPKGLFAKAVGCMPGDSIKVVNPITGKSVTLLVLGTIDSSEGFAIRLSKSAADSLEIKKGSNTQVTVTKLGDDGDTFGDDTDAMAIIDDTSAIVEPKIERVASAKGKETSEEVFVPVVEIPNNRNDSDSDTESVEESEAKSDEIEVEEAIATEDEKIASTKERSAKEEAVNEDLPPNEYGDESKLEAKSLDDIEGITGDSGAQDKNAAPVEEVDETAPSLARKKAAKSEAVNEAAPKLEEEKSSSPKTEVVDASAPALENNTKKIANSEAVANEELPPVEYGTGAIVLKPAAVNPPTEEDKNSAEATKKAEEERKAVSQAYLERKKAEDEAKAAAEVERAKEEAEKAKAVAVASDNADREKADEAKKADKIASADEPKKSASKAKDVTGFDDYIVPDVDKLKAGNYVQIASLSDKENIKGIVKTYGNKYPIEVVPSSVKKNSYQILIGPLGVDEYGTVLERFKSRGYRDAYIRKIK